MVAVGLSATLNLLFQSIYLHQTQLKQDESDYNDGKDDDVLGRKGESSEDDDSECSNSNWSCVWMT